MTAPRADGEVPRGGRPGATPVPRPTDVRPGRPPPWHALAPEARRGLSLGVVRGALVREGRTLAATPPAPLDELLGVDADAAAALRESAVLLALFEEDGEARVVLTRRSAALRRHRGEVALPGGRLDPDEAPLAAALREAHEEVALDPSAVSPIGWLRPLVTFASGSLIRPYVGALEARPALRAHPDEVARVFDVSLAELVADGAFHEEQWRRRSPRAAGADGFVPIYFYDVDGETVWGATARILTELCALVVGVEPR